MERTFFHSLAPFWENAFAISNSQASNVLEASGDTAIEMGWGGEHRANASRAESSKTAGPVIPKWVNKSPHSAKGVPLWKSFALGTAKPEIPFVQSSRVS